MLAYERQIAEHDVQKRKASGGDQSTKYRISEAVGGLSYKPMVLWDSGWSESSIFPLSLWDS